MVEHQVSNDTISSGLDILQVLSDDKHYTPFVCSVCVRILALDAVVAKDCSHAYCLSCLERQVSRKAQQDNPTTNTCCPQCKGELAAKPKTAEYCMPIASANLNVQPLQEAQPLAYQCLTSIQVACMGFGDGTAGNNSKQQPCTWSGNYGDYPQHLAECACCHPNNGNYQPNPIANDGVAAMDYMIRSPSKLPRHNLANIKARPPVQRTKSLPSLFAVPDSKANNEDDGSILQSPSLSPQKLLVNDPDGMGMYSPGIPTTPVKLPNSQGFRKSASMRDFSRELRDVPPPTPNRTSSPKGSHNNSFVLQQQANGSGFSQPARWATGETSDNGWSGDESSPETRDMPPNLVKRTKSGVPKQQQLQQSSPSKLGGSRMNTAKPVPEDKRLRKYSRKKSSGAGVGSEGNHDSLSDEGGGSSENWNTSINSLTAWGGLNNSTSALKTMAQVEEESSMQSTSKSSSPGRGDVLSSPRGGQEDQLERIQAILARAEKLKKQANAKFNKGDFNAARSLYSEGIKCMADISRMGPKEGEMLSNMHSNRAVTFFREKNFVSCIQDCDVAIQYDPYYEKSWIRKWRALMALGQSVQAMECLENGVNSLPESSKIKKELQKAKADMEVVEKAKNLLEKREYEMVKDMLKTQIKNAAMDNIAILHLAARADAYLGLMDASMEKINRALRYNPTQADGLAVRGAVLYLAGETEKGLHLLQDAYGRDKENKSIKLELQQCQRTHQSLTKGRSCVKRGRYLEAVEHFTAAMKEKTLVPEKTPLYATVRCERAEAWMLSSKYREALKDCQDVINAQEENATAWTVRAEILIALGKAHEAEKELNTIRRSWGIDNPTVEEGYRRVDFELRVVKADDELTKFVETLEQGLGQSIQPSSSSKLDTKRLITGNSSRRLSCASTDSMGASGASSSEDRPTTLGGGGSERKTSSGNKSDSQQRSNRPKRSQRNKSLSSASSHSEVGTDSVLMSPSAGSAASSPRRISKNSALRKATSSRRLHSEERQTSSRRLTDNRQTSRRHLSEDRQTSSRRLGSTKDKQTRALERKISERQFDKTANNERGSVKRI